MRKRLFVWIGSALAPVAFVFLAHTGTFSLAASAIEPLAPPMTFTVTTNGDMGAGSLREAIDQANTNPGIDSINFDPGLGTINVGAVTGLPLPTITEGVTIDGGPLKIELNGTASGGDGFTIMAPAGGVTIQNMVINRFPGSGINIQGDGNKVLGNLIGVDTTGTMALPNAGVGVLVNGANNVIGGTTAAARNVISGNNGSGVSLASSLCHDNSIIGNFIGTDSGGSGALPNQSTGVVLLGGSSNNTIGGLLAGSGNTIAFNGGMGIFIVAGLGNRVLSNSIFSNEAVGINLSDDPGVTPNDPCDPDTGANDLQNFPDLTSATTFGGTTTIQGTLDSNPVSTFRIEFFASASCDLSGNGQGKTFLGAANVSTNGACTANITATVGVAVPTGQVITATATDPSGNTSEFSACVTVMPAAGCTIACPPGILASTGPSSTMCGVPVDYPAPTTIGGCGTVTCTPPSGSVFAVGSTNVNCSEGSGASCSFQISVADNTLPRLSCGTGLTTTAAPGASSAIVNYPAPTASDNCPQVEVRCSPPSGSAFPIATTLVTCTATDQSTNLTNCFFNITVVDADAPVITCPANVDAAPQAGQTSAVVNFPPPTVTDNLPGTTFACSPTSGSTFPVGVTPVTCTAIDANGNRSSCSFNVSVGGAVVSVLIPGGKAAVEFGNPSAVNSRRKPQKPKNNACSLFQIENIGFAPLVLTLDSFVRVGADVDSGKIANPDDSRYFSLSLVNADQSQTSLDLGAVLTLQAQKAQSFCLRFSALLPPLAGKTTGLPAAQVLPNTMNSRVVFRQNGGASIAVPVLSHVGTALSLINPANPKRPAEVTFTKSGNTFEVSYAVHDSNLDLNRAKYEFLNAGGQVVGEAFELDLAEPLRALNLVRGQSVGIAQSFTGASDHPEVTGVRVTVFDGETSAIVSASQSSITLASSRLSSRTQRITLYPPAAMLGPRLP